MGDSERVPSGEPYHLLTEPRRVSGEILKTTDETAPDPADELLGKLVGGRYRITAVLGRGGMGVVYRARHLELDHDVAIKVLPASYARDAETLKRFEREARTASRVHHPNVVTVFDLGRLDTGEPYLVMELLDGSDLDQVMRDRGTLPLKDVIEMMLPIAAAIDALHLEGVVHRDIKPSNIFFTKTKAMGEIVKLVDFGIAALHSAEGAERLTQVGHVVGTPVYMAPESARGDLSGPRGDTYALAVVAYEMLAGAPPFDGPPMAVLLEKISQPAPTLSAITGSKYDEAVEAAFAIALQRDPTRRPATATAFIEMLRAALRHGAAMPRAGVRSRPPPKSRDARAEAPRATAELASPRRRKRAWWLAPVLVSLVVLGGGAAWTSRTRSTPVPVTTTTTMHAPGVVPELATTPAPARGVDGPPDEITPTGATAQAQPTRPRARTVLPARTVAAALPPEIVEPTSPPPAADVLEEPTPTVALEPSPPPTSTAEPPSTETEPATTDRASDLVRAGQTAMLHGQMASARALYEEATQAAPSSAAAWRGLGLASERLGLAPEARRAYERYLELAPDARDATTVRDRLTRLAP